MIIDLDLIGLTVTAITEITTETVIVVDPEGSAAVMLRDEIVIETYDLVELTLALGGPLALVQLLELRQLLKSYSDLEQEIQTYASQSIADLAS